MESLANGRVELHCGDSREKLSLIADCSIDSVVTDPPYSLVSISKRFGKEGSAPAKAGTVYGRSSAGFMNAKWDNGETAFSPDFWEQVYRVLKPGGHLLAFGGTRTFHRLACAIEDAGFEIRDQIAWLYGSGFPKSHNVSKGIDKAAGAEREVVGTTRASIQRNGSGENWERGAFGSHSEETKRIAVTAPSTDAARQWEGWGTALKPACEPICLARKPLSENTVAANVLEHGTGAINIDGCRVVAGDSPLRWEHGRSMGYHGAKDGGPCAALTQEKGRWPANVILDGSPEVVEAFPDAPGQQFATGPQYERNANVYGKFAGVTAALPRGDSGSAARFFASFPGEYKPNYKNEVYGNGMGGGFHPGFNDSGSAARFFYTAKAGADDRLGSKHPTVKPLDLMQYLCRLVTPKGGTVLDPFAGTGTTGEAAFREGFNAVLIERETEYQNDIRRRMSLVLGGPEERQRAIVKAKGLVEDAGPLFGGLL